MSNIVKIEFKTDSEYANEDMGEITAAFQQWLKELDDDANVDSVKVDFMTEQSAKNKSNADLIEALHDSGITATVSIDIAGTDYAIELVEKENDE